MTRKRIFSLIAAALFLLSALWIFFDAQIDAAFRKFVMEKYRGRYLTYGTNYSGRHPMERPSTLALGDFLFALPCLACAVLFAIKGLVKEDKIPGWVFFIVCGVYIVVPVVFECEYIIWDRQMGGGISQSGASMLALTSIIFLALKKKTKKVFFIPCAWSVLYAVILAVETLDYNKQPYIRPRQLFLGEAWVVLLSILVQGAAWFFMLWVLIKERTDVAPSKAAAPENAAVAETVEESDLLPELAASQTPETNATGAASKLTQRQKEDLENAKELFELGAIDEAEYEAEKQRIMLGL